MHYVVSDVHGHCEDLVASLRRARLLDSLGAWRGGRARLTFLGDYFDRGPDGIAVVDLVRRLQGEADATGGRVDAMIGNHEILALGMSRFGGQHVPSDSSSGRSFARSWALNGGQVRDQLGLTDAHITWLSGLDSVVLAGSDLLLHSDTTQYLRWGDTKGQINDAVRTALAGDDIEQWWQCWVRLTTRYAFAGVDGEEVATNLLDRLGGTRIVHGHSVITTFTGQDPGEVSAPFTYAGALQWRSMGASTAGAPAWSSPLSKGWTPTAHTVREEPGNSRHPPRLARDPLAPLRRPANRLTVPGSGGKRRLTAWAMCAYS